MSVFRILETDRTFLNGPIFLGVPPVDDYSSYCFYLLKDLFPSELDDPYTLYLNPKGDILLELLL